MNWQRPSSLEVWKAIDIYLRVAYDGTAPPSAVRGRLDILHAVAEADFYDSAVLERDPADGPVRYKLRLGNRFYPQMKLAIECSPDGKAYLFRADTHDRHCMPDPTSAEYGLFCHLVENNQAMAQTIEAAWEAAGLPTFKSYLRDDLARRKAEQPA